jgi:hypothetical protein
MDLKWIGVKVLFFDKDINLWIFIVKSENSNYEF